MRRGVLAGLAVFLFSGSLFLYAASSRGLSDLPEREPAWVTLYAAPQEDAPGFSEEEMKALGDYGAVRTALGVRLLQGELKGEGATLLAELRVVEDESLASLAGEDADGTLWAGRMAAERIQKAMGREELPSQVSCLIGEVSCTLFLKALPQAEDGIYLTEETLSDRYAMEAGAIDLVELSLFPESDGAETFAFWQARGYLGAYEDKADVLRDRATLAARNRWAAAAWVFSLIALGTAFLLPWDGKGLLLAVLSAALGCAAAFFTLQAAMLLGWDALTYAEARYLPRLWEGVAITFSACLWLAVGVGERALFRGVRGRVSTDER